MCWDSALALKQWRMASLYCCFWLSVGWWNRTTVVGAFLGWAFSFTRKLAVTMLWSLLNAISVLAEISRMLFLKARGAKMKSIWAKRSGDQGAVKPSVAVSLKVHFLLVGFRNNVFMIRKSAKRQKSISSCRFSFWSSGSDPTCWAP